MIIKIRGKLTRRFDKISLLELLLIRLTTGIIFRYSVDMVFRTARLKQRELKNCVAESKEVLQRH